jgi:hypothetical protein
VVCAAVAEAQQPTKIPQIGFLSATSFSIISARIDAFRRGLRELGYVKAKNISIEYRYAEGKLDGFSRLESLRRAHRPVCRQLPLSLRNLRPPGYVEWTFSQRELYEPYHGSVGVVASLSRFSHDTYIDRGLQNAHSTCFMVFLSTFTLARFRRSAHFYRSPQAQPAHGALYRHRRAGHACCPIRAIRHRAQLTTPLG